MFILVRKEKTSYEDYDVEDDLGKPENAENWKKPVSSLSARTIELLYKKLPPQYEDDRNLCYCNYSPEVCGGLQNQTCLKYTEAACFYHAKKVYDNEVGDYVIEEQYGCAPLTRGSGGSYFTCYGNLVPHHKPMGIRCCYEGDYCNYNLTLPTLLTKKSKPSTLVPALIWSITGVLVGLIFIIIVFFVFNKYMAGKLKKPLKNAVSLAADPYSEKSPICIDMSSGSGSGFASLREKTAAQYLEMIDIIGCGRYGEVKKALFKGDRIVAVKSFCTKDEQSWKNEKEIYQTQMLNNENILQFVAADISSEDSITRLLLITDFHEYGSLHEYLQCDGSLSVLEALKLAETAACGLVHLHSRIRGTGTPVKPAIAHRDIKSKNILVKRRGVCCIADFGLALSEDMISDGKYLNINVQVGTKRYMAPEILNKTLNPKCFYDFLMADVYSFSLVIWEILRRVQECKALSSDALGDSGYGSSGSGNKANVTRPCIVSSGMASMVPLLGQSSSLEKSLRKPIQPYDDIFPCDPSLEDMRKIVCEQKKRPVFDALLKTDHVLEDVCAKVEECWAENIHARPQIYGVKQKLSDAISASFTN